MAYATVDGIITSPGKFEGEASYLPYMWERSVEDGCVADEFDVYTVEVDAEDVERFPMLERVDDVSMYEDEQGFVYELTNYNPGAVEQGIYEYENDL